MDKLHIHLLAIVILSAIVAIFLVSSNYEFKLIYAEQNMTSNEPSKNLTDLLSNRGLNMLLYTKNGGITGNNEIYTYNIATKEVVYVNSMNEVKRKTLTQDEIDNLNNIFYDIGFSEVYDRKICPDCTQYGLSYSFIDFEYLLKISSFSYWTDQTQKPNVEGLNNLTSTIEQLIKSQ